MKVEGTWRRAIELAPGGDAIVVLDQTALPHRVAWLRMGEFAEAARAIRDMVVRGAPLIGATAAYGVALAVRAGISVDDACRTLAATRPTAINLAWALAAMRSIADVPATERAAAAFARAAQLCDDEVARCAAIGRHGLAVLEAIARGPAAGRPVRVLTHCNAGWLATVDWGTALAPIYHAHEAGLAVEVWVDETRPRNQGLLTAWELAQHGVPHTVIADNAGGHLMQRGLVDLCIVGTDRTTRAGDVCNKIGTYLKALAAHDTGVPFYVAAPSPSIDWTIARGADIPIEERAAAEVRRITGVARGAVTEVELVPPGTAVANPAFDVTPARLVTGLITERGTCAASPAGLAALFPDHADPGAPVTQALRDELVATAREMSELGLAPGTTGNVSARTSRGFVVTPSGMRYDQLRGDDAVAIEPDGTVRPGQRAPSTEWQLHRDLYAARPDVAAIVHTHSLFCTTVSCLRRPIPAIHYMVVRAGGDDIPCADYATFGTAELAAAVVRALGAGRACLMANHGMVALGETLSHALQLAAEVETLASQYWHAAQLTQLGPPHVLPHDELDRVRAQFAGYGQRKRGPRGA